MKKHFFLGESAHYTSFERLRHLFSIGNRYDAKTLRDFLAQKYQATKHHVALTKNGRLVDRKSVV